MCVSDLAVIGRCKQEWQCVYFWCNNFSYRHAFLSFLLYKDILKSNYSLRIFSYRLGSDVKTLKANGA